MKKIILLSSILLFPFFSYCQSRKNPLQELFISTENMRHECSTFLLATVKPNKKGLIDSLNFITGEKTLFAQNIKDGFDVLKRKKEKIGKIPLVIFFVFVNSTEGEGFDSNKCPADILSYPLFAKTLYKKSIFIGPYVIDSGIKDHSKELKPAF